MAMAGDEGSTRFEGAGVTSPSPELLFSLGTALLPLTVSVPGAASPALVSLSPLSRAAALVSSDSGLVNLWLCQAGSCQRTPVKLLRRRGCRSHLRQGAPVRSKARSPALMAPVLALGPSRWVAGNLPVSTPSSLQSCVSFYFFLAIQWASLTVVAFSSGQVCPLLVHWVPPDRLYACCPAWDPELPSDAGYQRELPRRLESRSRRRWSLRPQRMDERPGLRRTRPARSVRRPCRVGMDPMSCGWGCCP